MVALEQLIIPLIPFIFFVIFLHKWRSGAASTPRKNLPPSPRKLPIIGNLHQLGTSPHRSLQSLSNRYGKLLLLHFGRVPVLIVSSAEAAREIMKNQDLIFSNRPKLSIPDRLIYGSRDVAFAPYGEYWRQVRSICVLQLLSNKRVQSYRRVREEETSAMVEKIRQLGFSSSVVNLSDVLVSLTNDIICRVALGRKYNDYGEDKKFKNLLLESGELLGATSLGDYIPWLGWIDRVNGLDARVEKNAKMVDEFLEVVLQEHRGAKKREEELDFVDILLQFQRENKGSSPIEDDTIKALIQVTMVQTDHYRHVCCWNGYYMFCSGVDNSRAYKNPRVMKILQNEVREVDKRKEEIGEDDVKKMPYLKAVIKESLRLHSPVPLLIPRESTQDTKIMGYDISAGTRVVINAWAIARDPSLWENPEDFIPERFLGSSIDFRGLHFELVPFGSGRRGCPGIAFAMAVDELALAKLVHTFNFALPNGGREEDLNMSETTGITVHKKFPLLVAVTSHISTTYIDSSAIQALKDLRQEYKSRNIQEENKLGKFGFMDPLPVGVIPSTKLSDDEKLEQRTRALADRLMGTLIVVLVPCNVGFHWILTVIDPHKEVVSLFDPLSHRNRYEDWKKVVNFIQVTTPVEISTKCVLSG
ncbi:hypothetical protein DH2020_019191 [Rehmannia glutinosa]|uniref:Uncharacterized protein n=1 Tax=Rehmannia glutinosa TaxID=99300 RepID=A0ABR0WQ44_REHGL